MIKKISITVRGGIEVYSYTSPGTNYNKDSQLLSGLFYAIQSVSEEINDPVSSIRLLNSVIYVKTYSDFSILLIFSKPINNEIKEEIFRNLAKLTIYYFEKLQKFDKPDEFVLKIQELIKTLNQEEKITSNIFSIENFSIKKRIAIAGLSKAGKTSIIKKFFNKWNNERVSNINPTIGVETSKNFVQFLNESVVTLDFGGQKSYRKSYIANTNNWKNLTTLIYVVDIQQPVLFNESKKYLDEIYTAISESNSLYKPFFSIFIHKYDIEKREEIKKYLEQFFSIFKDYSEKTLFYLTSIYDESCIDAVLKTIFFSMPTIMIKQIFERVLVDKLEKDFFHENNILKVNDLNEAELFSFGLTIGEELSNEFQKQWLNTFIGNFDPSPRGILAKQIQFKIEDHFIKIVIENWKVKGIPPEITDPILTGVIRGIMNSLFLNNELKTIRDKFNTSWSIEY